MLITAAGWQWWLLWVYDRFLKKQGFFFSPTSRVEIQRDFPVDVDRYAEVPQGRRAIHSV